MVAIKSKSEIEKMKQAGRVTYGALCAVRDGIRPGVTTKELDKIAEDYIRANGCTPSFKGYGGFPGSVCASVNDEIIHGIPGKRVLEEGDIISIDVGACYQGYHSDACRTFPVGKISEEAKRLIDVTRQSFFEARISNFGYLQGGSGLRGGKRFLGTSELLRTRCRSGTPRRP